MGERIYIDKSSTDGAFGVFFARDIQIVFTGLDVSTERDEAVAAEVSRLCGMDFFLREQSPEISLYCVPYLEIFASDGQGGWFAVTETLRDGPVYYIDRDRTPHLTAERSRLFHYMVLPGLAAEVSAGRSLAPSAGGPGGAESVSGDPEPSHASAGGY